MLELFDDHRFVKECNDSQKLDYLLWIAMAGLTQNEAPNDPEWFKTRFNLDKKVDEIEANTRFLTDTFKKMFIQKRGDKSVVKFTKFKELHNYIRKPQGFPEECLGTAQNRIDIEKKENIDKILQEFLSLQKIDAKDNAALMHDLYVRNCRPIKKLLLICKTPEEASAALKWVGDWLGSKNLSWTLETVIKHYTTYLKETAGKTGIDKWRVYKT
jgi:hypothetical protein